MLPFAIRFTTALSLGAAAVGEGVCKGGSCGEAPVDLLQNQVKVHKKTDETNNKCFDVGMGDLTGDDDTTYGCSNNMHTVWSFANAPARDANATQDQSAAGGDLSGSEYWSKDKCYNLAAVDSNCGGRVLYHKGGTRCYCIKDADAWCKRKNMPSYHVADCTCTLHQGTTCAKESDFASPPKLDKTCTAAECLEACINEGSNTGCCQWNDKNNNCKLFDGGADDDWKVGYLAKAGNEHKNVMLLDECYA